jgi:hypothetical protein
MAPATNARPEAAAAPAHRFDARRRGIGERKAARGRQRGCGAGKQHDAGRRDRRGRERTH